MGSPEARAAVRACVETLLALVLTAVAAYFWAAATTTHAACEAGGGGGWFRTLGFAVLWLAGPVFGGWRASTLGVREWNVVGLVFVALCVGFALVFLGDAFWWSGHGCSD